jgi:hypothetical protein
MRPFFYYKVSFEEQIKAKDIYRAQIAAKKRYQIRKVTHSQELSSEAHLLQQIKETSLDVMDAMY